jgi:hypothetical protein
MRSFTQEGKEIRSLKASTAGYTANGGRGITDLMSFREAWLCRVRMRFRELYKKHFLIIDRFIIKLIEK